MAVIFIEGFDHFATADLSKKGWVAAGAAAAVGSTVGRRGTGAFYGPNAGSSGCVTKTFGAKSSFVVGVAFYASQLVNAPIISFLDAGAAQCELRLLSDGTLSVTRNGSALAGGISSNSLTVGAFYYIEWKFTIADAIAAASSKVRVNNADWITVATGQDLKNTANASANQIRLGSNSAIGTGVTWLFDDMYLLDQTGTSNNDFLGDQRIETLIANADGTYSAFTPSTGTAHYANVDDATPNTTDYNDGLNVGDRDSYGLTDLPALTSQTINCVQVNAAINKDDTGAKSAALMVRSGGVNGDGLSTSLGTSQLIVSQVFETNPNGNVAWTESTVNAMEAGVLVTA